VNASAILAANGMSYADIDEQRLNFNETADALANGDIDAGFWSVGAPTSAILNLATRQSIRMLALSDAEIAAARAADPTFARATLPGGTYSGIDQDVTVLGIPNLLVVSAAMPDDLAYQLTRALFEHLEELVAVHPAARQITVELTFDTMPVPLHPGAIRYFEEIGAAVAGRLRP
jgi:TRAP transporter TAXI family solute receptor